MVKNQKRAASPQIKRAQISLTSRCISLLGDSGTNSWICRNRGGALCPGVPFFPAVPFVPGCPLSRGALCPMGELCPGGPFVPGVPFVQGCALPHPTL